MPLAPPLSAYLTIQAGDTGDAWVFMDAANNVYASLTLADITAKTVLDNNLGNTAFQSTINIQNITGGGKVDIALGTPLRLEYVASGTTATVVTPGTVQFTSGTIATVSASTLGLNALNAYVTSVNSVDNSVTYTLPSRTGLKVTGGKVSFVSTENYGTFDASSYQYQLNGSNQMILLLAGTFTSGVTPESEHRRAAGLQRLWRQLYLVPVRQRSKQLEQRAQRNLWFGGHG